MTTLHLRRPRPRGFTLIEMLTVLCILSVLMLIALPNYSSYQRRAHRAEARAALVQAAQWMERAATANGRYPAGADIPPGLLVVHGDRYALQIHSPDPAQTASTATFKIVANRNRQSDQAKDECGDFVLDQAQRRSVLNARASAAHCWSH